MSDQPPKPRRSPPWAKLTRRRFLRGVLATAGAAAAATTVVEVVTPGAAPAPKRYAGKTRWIGHC
jgi:hypothetical protein